MLLYYYTMIVSYTIQCWRKPAVSLWRASARCLAEFVPYACSQVTAMPGQVGPPGQARPARRGGSRSSRRPGHSISQPGHRCGSHQWASVNSDVLKHGDGYHNVTLCLILLLYSTIPKSALPYCNIQYYTISYYITILYRKYYTMQSFEGAP